MCFLSFQAQRPVPEGLENETWTWCPGTTHLGAQVLEAMTLETFLLRLSFPFITPCRSPSLSIGIQCLFYFSLGFSLMGKLGVLESDLGANNVPATYTLYDLR